jgi:hypothetical protein
MRAILDSVARTFLSAHLLAIVGLTAACSTTPKYPEPTDYTGQILVQLDGRPKEGVKGSKREGAGDEYSNRQVSIEQGKAFERVDYAELEDVVVICSGCWATGNCESPSIEIDDKGFSRSQFGLQLPGMIPGNASIEFFNKRKERLTIVAVPSGETVALSNRTGTLEITVPANGSSKMSFSTRTYSTRYDLYCDEDESMHSVLHVSMAGIWAGSSVADAFFDNVEPGEPTVTVYPPRLPEWSKKLIVTAGKRTTVTAELTVNTLPKVGK